MPSLLCRRAVIPTHSSQPAHERPSWEGGNELGSEGFVPIEKESSFLGLPMNFGFKTPHIMHSTNPKAHENH